MDRNPLVTSYEGEPPEDFDGQVEAHSDVQDRSASDVGKVTLRAPYTRW